MVADSELVLEEEGGAVAPQGAVRHDGLAVRQDVRLVHEVRRQQDHLSREEEQEMSIFPLSGKDKWALVYRTAVPSAVQSMR